MSSLWYAQCTSSMQWYNGLLCGAGMLPVTRECEGIQATQQISSAAGQVNTSHQWSAVTLQEFCFSAASLFCLRKCHLNILGQLIVMTNFKGNNSLGSRQLPLVARDRLMA